MGGSLSIANVKTRQQAGKILQIRQTTLTAFIVFHALFAWYLAIQTLVSGNCLPDTVPPGLDEVFVPHAIWILALMPVTLIGLLAARHEVTLHAYDFRLMIYLFYVTLAVCMLANAVALGFFSWELHQCATDYCMNNKGFLIGGNIVLHAVVIVLEGAMIALAYVYSRDMHIALRKNWQPHWTRERDTHVKPHAHVMGNGWENVPKKRT